MELNYIDLVNRINQYYNSATKKKLDIKVEEKPFLVITKKARDEISHSNFLGWLFDTPDIQAKVVTLFIQAIYNRGMKQNPKLKSLTYISTFIPISLYGGLSVSDINVERECKTENGRKIDIVVEFAAKNSKCAQIRKIRLVIENKVYAKESADQTTDYYTNYNGKDKYKNIYIYLTPKPNSQIKDLKEASCQCKDFLEMNYQDILDGVLESLCVDNDISEYYRKIIQDYINTLTYFTTPESEGKNNKKNEYKFMAMDTTTRELLESFFNENRDLITTSLEALRDVADDEENEELAEQLHEITGVKNSNAKDYTKYTTNIDGHCNPYGKTELVAEIAKDYLSKHTQEEFAKNFKSTQCYIGQYVDNVNKIHPRFGTCPDKDGKEAGYSKQWTKANIGKFLDEAKKQGYEIKRV
ncbi:MAG: PD-(D/E)XK nuclease family protein [Bacteroidales bacterium]|nr:PD-(D/E)XK nuclease family protein [Bacteroidales bacterium]